MYDVQFLTDRVAASGEIGNMQACFAWTLELVKRVPEWFKGDYFQAEHRSYGQYKIAKKHVRVLWEMGMLNTIDVPFKHNNVRNGSSNLGDGITEICFECSHCGQGTVDEYQWGEQTIFKKDLFCNKAPK